MEQKFVIFIFTTGLAANFLQLRAKVKRLKRHRMSLLYWQSQSVPSCPESQNCKIETKDVDVARGVERVFECCNDACHQILLLFK